MSNVLERTTKMLIAADRRMEELGKEPYGVTKLSPKEQRQMYDALRPEDLYPLIQEHGVDSVNKFLAKFENKEAQ
jgi:hypothetical protein